MTLKFEHATHKKLEYSTPPANNLTPELPVPKCAITIHARCDLGMTMLTQLPLRR